MQQQMTIGTKFAFTSSGLVAAMVLVGIVSIYNLAGLNNITQQIITDPLPGMDTIATAEAALLRVQGDVRRHLCPCQQPRLLFLHSGLSASRSERRR